MPTSTARPQLPTNEELQKFAYSLARRIAHIEADIDDLVQEALWALHLQTKKTRIIPRKPWAFAKTVMLRHMYIYYTGQWTHSGARHNQMPTVSLEDTIPLTCNPWEQVDTAIDLERFLKSLEAICGRTARQIAENLIQPSDRPYCSKLIANARRKTREHENGAAVRGFKQIRLRVSPMMVLRTRLGLSQKQWYRIVGDIRRFTETYPARGEAGRA